MWCSNCHQETPGVAHATSGRIVCSRCQRPEKRKAPHATRICDDGLALDEPTPARANASSAPFRADDWAARQRVRTVARELRRPNPAAIHATNRVAADRMRLDPPHDLFIQLEQATAPGLAPTSLPSVTAIQQKHSDHTSQLIAWLIVVTGALVLSCGVGLIAWSLSNREMQYWNLALGLAIGGQGALVLGLVMLIARLWRSSRYAAAKLQDVHARLGQVQQAAEGWNANRASSAPAFYADLVRGASPHIMLANIKGQVDQLATRVGGSW